MKIIVPAQRAMHGGRYGMEVQIDQAFSKNFHAQFSLPHFMPRMAHSAYQLTFWAKVTSASAVVPEIAFLDVDEGYEWVGGGELSLSDTWQHIAMNPVYTLPSHKGHEIQIAFLIGATPADFFFDDIQLYEMEVPSPPPPSPPPPPNVLLWLDGEGGPKGVQTVIKAGAKGVLTADLSSTTAAHESVYGYEVSVTETFEEDYYGMLSLPAFLVTDHERVYAFTFWAKATGNPKPRPHITFQDEDNDYAWIDGQYVGLSAFWHKYEVNLVVPYKLRGHNVVTNLMLGSFAGVYYFDDFMVSNSKFASPPPSPPSPPPSPPPTVLLQFTLEDYVKGTINPQAYSEGEMEVVVQSPNAAHNGKYGLLITVTKAFDYDWHAQVSLKPFTPPDTSHGYIFSFWGRASATHGAASMRPKVVFQDKDDEYVPLKQVTVPLEAEWNMYQVDLSIPKYRRNHAIVINFWVGEAVGSFSFDDMQVNIVNKFEPPPPPPPTFARHSPPPPGVVAVLTFENSDEAVTSQRMANNGTWLVSVPDARAGHLSGMGLYVEVERAWKVASLAQLLLPRYVPRAGQETLLHLSFWARVEKMKSTDPPPCVTIAFVDMHSNNQVLGTEEVMLTSNSWQLYYVLVDLKKEHLMHSIRPLLYLGKAEGIYSFDDFEYKEIEIEDGMQWLQRAPERIKHKRMGRFALSFRDKDDWMIDYGNVALKLQSHAFPFGVSLKSKQMSQMDSKEYIWYLEMAAKHFWAGTIERQMQWDAYEPQPGNVASAQKAVEDLTTWARSQNWAPLSATLFDGGHGDKDHWSNKLTCKDLEEHIRSRIIRELHQFGGKIGRYEVWKDSMRWRDWISRCGQELYFSAYRWAHSADSNALLTSSEADVLTTPTLTGAESYHNMLWEMAHDKKVPLHGIGVQAHFQGPVDASTVKHRLDVLREVQLPVYITEFSISGLDASKHAYELEKFLRIAFSHEAVAGITLGDLWDTSSTEGDSGIYMANKQPKPAAAKVDKLWREEWHTEINDRMHSDGTLDFEGFYGTYEYQVVAGDQVCTGIIDLIEDPNLNPSWVYDKRSQDYVIKCDFKGQMHVPVWATPAGIALVFVSCLLGCWFKRRELVHTVDHSAYDKAPTRTT